ncbi:MAG: SRPBCC domain-containing protein [Myxococcales bacterium]|nr:SRPBCC domain-containing protein [Myxococcales bacterium]
MKNNRKKIATVIAVLGIMMLVLTQGDSMFELRTETEIAAPPEVVWAVLTDAESFGDWNPFIHEMDGALQVGGQLRVTVGAPGKSRMTFKPQVLTADENRELRWRGKLLVRGVMDGEHVFELQPTEDGTRFLHYEHFSGVLVPLLKGMLERDTLPGFEAMNEALKARAEARVLAAR